ncbi:MAG TPA: hypothetical protein VMM92_10340 [Thermoanaerobaculia bacterium]|nr:hypothetical protein [Thermoanaerobaculia bacterium]
MTELGPAARLFSGYAEADLGELSFLLARLLEDGDSPDLHGLFQRVPESRAAQWFAVHGGRQLSKRSQAFWQTVLGVPAGPAAPGIDALWPL